MAIIRNTIQRSLVLEAVNQLKCHATAEEVYQAVASKHPHISKGTVYRNLSQLAESGEIRRLEVPGGADCFDHICTNHYHVKCSVCGRVFDVDMEYMENLERCIRDRHGFQFSGHTLMFEGICPECQKKSNSLQQSNSPQKP